MRFYRSTMLAVLFGASTIGCLSHVHAQSFDYPDNSESIISRWAAKPNSKTTSPDLSSSRFPGPQNSPSQFSLKRFIPAQKIAPPSKLVERIRAFDSRKAYSLPAPVTGDSIAIERTRQASWAAALPRRQVEQSILEVVEQGPSVDLDQPRYSRNNYEPISRTSKTQIPKTTPNVNYSNVAALSTSTQTPVATASPSAVNSSTTADAFPLPKVRSGESGLTSTQAILKRQRQQNQNLARTSNTNQRSVTEPRRFAEGSFENEFNKAYEVIVNEHAKRAASTSTAPPSVRVAQKRSVNAVSAGHSLTDRELSSNDGPAFDLIEQNTNAPGELQLPPLGDSQKVAPGDFRHPDLGGPSPNENADFAPPGSMLFEAPAQPATEVEPQREPDILPSLKEATSDTSPEPVFSSEPAFVSPPQSPAAPKVDLVEQFEEFAPVETSKTWKPPVIPTSPTEQMVPEHPTDLAAPSSSVETIEEDVAWWKSRVGQPLHVQNTAQPVDTNGLVLEALRSSPLIKSVSKTPLIRELQVVEADAEFDAVRFLNSQFQDRVDPVGNSLTTGGEPFLEDNIWTAEGGIRKRLRNGGNYSLSQTLGFQNSNSTFFTPQDQGTATLALNVTQPLLRGRGRYINQAQILIAQSTGSAAWDTFKSELQEELEGMVTAYWDLYLQRSIFLQKKRNVERGQVMLDRLLGRKDLDSLPAQIARAKSAVLTRRTELANAFRDVRNAETEIRRRVADKNWQASQSVELLPMEMPFAQLNGLELEQVVYTALENRPEIAEAIRRIRIAGVQRDVSANELLPELSLLLGTYVSSLRGDTGILNAFQDQFGQVTPGYSVGLEYELPYRNRAARSRFQQRNLQLRRLQNELENVIQNVIAESQVATRQVTSAFETLKAAREAVVASRADLLQNQKRWESFALVEGDLTDGQSPTVVLDQLLDSQERLAQAENVFAEAEQGLKIAEVSLQRTMGTLLMHQQVDFSRSVKCDVPTIHINKANASAARHLQPAQPEFSSPSQFNAPQFNAPQHNAPEFVQQRPAQRRVSTLQSILPTPTNKEVARLMQPPGFSESSTARTSKDWTPPNNPISLGARQSGYSPTPTGIEQTGYRSDGSDPQFDFGYPAK